MYEICIVYTYVVLSFKLHFYNCYKLFFHITTCSLYFILYSLYFNTLLISLCL